MNPEGYRQPSFQARFLNRVMKRSLRCPFQFRGCQIPPGLMEVLGIMSPLRMRQNHRYPQMLMGALDSLDGISSEHLYSRFL